MTPRSALPVLEGKDSRPGELGRVVGDVRRRAGRPSPETARTCDASQDACEPPLGPIGTASDRARDSCGCASTRLGSLACRLRASPRTPFSCRLFRLSRKCPMRGRRAALLFQRFDHGTRPFWRWPFSAGAGLEISFGFLAYSPTALRCRKGNAGASRLG